MSHYRRNAEYDTLEEIIEAVRLSKFPELVWVGKNYSKLDLIKDLEKALEEQKKD